MPYFNDDETRLLEAITLKLTTLFPATMESCYTLAQFVGWDTACHQTKTREQEHLLNELAEHLKNKHGRVIALAIGLFILNSWSVDKNALGKTVARTLLSMTKEVDEFTLPYQRTLSELSEVEFFAFNLCIKFVNLRLLHLNHALVVMPIGRLKSFIQALQASSLKHLSIAISVIIDYSYPNDLSERINEICGLIRALHWQELSFVGDAYHYGKNLDTDFEYILRELALEVSLASIQCLSFHEINVLSGMSYWLQMLHASNLVKVKFVKAGAIFADEPTFWNLLHAHLVMTKICDLTFASMWSLGFFGHKQMIHSVCHVLKLPQLTRVDLSNNGFLKQHVNRKQIVEQLFAALQRSSLTCFAFAYNLGEAEYEVVNVDLFSLFLMFIKNGELKSFSIAGNNVSLSQLKEFFVALGVTKIEYVAPPACLEAFDCTDLLKSNTYLTKIQSDEKSNIITDDAILQRNHLINAIRKHIDELADEHENVLKKVNAVINLLDRFVVFSEVSTCYKALLSRLDDAVILIAKSFVNSGQYLQACRCLCLVSESNVEFKSLRYDAFEMAYSIGFNAYNNSAQAFLQALPSCIDSSNELITFSKRHQQAVFDRYLQAAIGIKATYDSAVSNADPLTIQQRDECITQLLRQQHRFLFGNGFTLFKAKRLNQLLELVCSSREDGVMEYRKP